MALLQPGHDFFFFFLLLFFDEHVLGGDERDGVRRRHLEGLRRGRRGLAGDVRCGEARRRRG